MLVECLRGVEEPTPEPQPAEEATLESACKETGAPSTQTSPEVGGSKLLPTPAFVFNPELLHTATPLSLASFIYFVRSEHPAPSYTRSYTRTHADPDKAHHADPCATQDT